MDNLSDKTLGELVDLAQEVGILDGSEKINGAFVFYLANRTIGIREAFAKTFVRGLLRGYELAMEVDKDE